MPLYVHLTSEKNVRRIERNGIKAQKIGCGCPAKGIYAMPVVENFYVSHQWLRELKRKGQRTICGVYFWLPKTEEVFVGHYSSQHVPINASQVAPLLKKPENELGFEVIVPRSISSKEIRRVKTLPQVVGWRYFPEAHGIKPCGCPACLVPGEIKSRKIREAFEKRK